MEDNNKNGSIRNGVIKKVANVLDYDYYGDGPDYGGQLNSSDSASGIFYKNVLIVNAVQKYHLIDILIILFSPL